MPELSPANRAYNTLFTAFLPIVRGAMRSEFKPLPGETPLPPSLRSLADSEASRPMTHAVVRWWIRALADYGTKNGGVLRAADLDTAMLPPDVNYAALYGNFDGKARSKEWIRTILLEASINHRYMSQDVDLILREQFHVTVAR